MILSNQDQLYQLFCCLGFGAVLSVYHDIFRLMRFFKPVSPIVLFIHDIIFCLTSAVGFFLFTLALSGGEAHLPMTAAVAVGFAASHTTVGRWLMRSAACFRRAAVAVNRCFAVATAKIGGFGRFLSKKVAVFFKKSLRSLYRMVYNQKQE